MKLRHLIRRFFGALRPGLPTAIDLDWVASVLTPDELGVWQRLPNHDQRHSVGVAREVQQQLADTSYATDTRWLEAALVHDIGKLDAGLGVYGRVVATVTGAVAGREHADAWSTKRGFTRRVGLYLRHPELGADRIRLAGGSDEAAAWAEAHHEPDRWEALAIPASVVAALDAADND